MFAPNIPSNGSMEVSYKIIGFNIILKWSNDFDDLGVPGVPRKPPHDSDRPVKNTAAHLRVGEKSS